MNQEKIMVGWYHDEDEVLRDLSPSLVRTKEHVEHGEYFGWSPDLMDKLSREADELVAQGYEPKSDVCP
jgi:hypothetical protein